MPQFFIDFHMFSMICIDLLTSSLIFVSEAGLEEDRKSRGGGERAEGGLEYDWGRIGGGLKEDWSRSEGVFS